MKLKKRTFFEIHSWIGIKLSVLFFIVCFSGTIATLSHELDWLFNPAIRATPQKEMAPRNLIRDNVKAKFPTGKITYWMKPEAPYLCDIVYVEEGKQRLYVFVNPYTGVVQGAAKITIQRYFRDLHYFLFIPFQIGHFTVLAFGFLLLFSVVTALVFYKKWYRKLFILTTGKGPLVFFRSLHRFVGLWSIPFSLLFVITGLWYFIERANVGGVNRYLRFETPRVEKDQEAWQGLTYDVDYDKAIATAKGAIPGLKVEKIVPPASTGSPLYVNGANHVPLVRSRANRVYLDPFTYEVLATQNAEAINTPTWLNDIADPLHFGYWGGLATKLIWFVMGMGISSLVLSGIWIAIRRQVKRRKAEKRPVLGLWKYLNVLVTAAMFFFMYHALFVRYGVAWSVIIAVTVCWVALLITARYVYVTRMSSSS